MLYLTWSLMEPQLRGPLPPLFSSGRTLLHKNSTNITFNWGHHQDCTLLETALYSYARSLPLCRSNSRFPLVSKPSADLKYPTPRTPRTLPPPLPRAARSKSSPGLTKGTETSESTQLAKNGTKLLYIDSSYIKTCITCTVASLSTSSQYRQH